MAANTDDGSKVMLRICDLTSEPNRMLTPIKGYEKQPLVPLDYAIQPLLLLVDDIEQMVWTVKQNCQQTHDHLTSDELASIMLYTLEWMPRESSFYYILNKTLRSQNRKELLPWFLYLRLFMFALSKLPSTKHRMIYRGIKMDQSDEYSKGKTVIFWAFSSAASSIEVLEKFVGKTGYRTIFNIECDSAKDISQHSFYPGESEILMYPARQFQVVSSFDSGNQLKIIHLREIQPPFPLIYIPETSSDRTDQVQEVKTPVPHIYISHISVTNNYQNQELQEFIKHCKHQSKVNLEKQSLTDEDMGIVVTEAIITKQCTILDLSYNKITLLGTSIIAKALNNNTNLKSLCLNGNCLCDPGIQPLTKTLLIDNSKLSLLDLQNTGISDAGAGYVAEMLKTNTTLTDLLLSYNEISDQGVELLTKTLTYPNITLKSLSLHYNRLVSDLSADFLVEMFKLNQTLQCLKIYGCSLTEEGKEKLRKIVRSKKDFELDV